MEQRCLTTCHTVTVEIGKRRIPKSFHTDQDRPYHIPCIEMPVELQDLLDYEGKIDRGSDNIGRLIAEGEKASVVFLRDRATVVAASPLVIGVTAGQTAG